jgi:hypothetical protein
MEVLFYFPFLFTALACSFAAYAEFASMVPVSGSAYTYSMSPLGIDGLDYWLGINHGICNGNITVAISWSDYFTGLLEVAESTCRNGFKWIT